MRIAADARKPIVIHTREAWDDTFALLESTGDPTVCPVSCIASPAVNGEAQRSLDLGF